MRQHRLYDAVAAQAAMQQLETALAHKFGPEYWLGKLDVLIKVQRARQRARRDHRDRH